MRFGDAVLQCLSKYAVGCGRAGPAEFWWFAALYLAVLALTLALVALSSPLAVAALGLAALLAPPLLAVTVRRLHDTGTPGWMLVFMVPVLGQLVLLVWLARHGVPRANRFGLDPEREREQFLLVVR